MDDWMDEEYYDIYDEYCDGECDWCPLRYECEDAYF